MSAPVYSKYHPATHLCPKEAKMADAKLNPLKLSIADAAKLLSKAGGQEVTEQQIREAIDAGAPVDADGNVNLVHLGAWILKEMNNHGN